MPGAKTEIPVTQLSGGLLELSHGAPTGRRGADGGGDPGDTVLAEAVAYVAERMNNALQAQARERRKALKNRDEIERDLRDAQAELGNIREAIRRGLLSDLTKQMLESLSGPIVPLSDRIHL